MTAPNLFEIENGFFGLMLVDEEAVGWSDDWQSPAGDTGSGTTASILAELSDYATPSAGWSATGWACQITDAAVSAQASTRTQTVKPTWCEPGRTIPTPDETSFSAVINFYQDAHVRQSLSLWLFENDTREAYVYLGMNNDDPPECVGVVRITAGAIGGAGRTPLETTATLSFTRKPLITRAAA